MDKLIKNTLVSLILFLSPICLYADNDPQFFHYETDDFNNEDLHYIQGEIIVEFQADAGDWIGEEFYISSPSIMHINDEFGLLEIKPLLAEGKGREQMYIESDFVSEEVPNPYMIFLLKFPEETYLDELITVFSNDPDIKFVAPNYLMEDLYNPRRPENTDFFTHLAFKLITRNYKNVYELVGKNKWIDDFIIFDYGTATFIKGTSYNTPATYKSYNNITILYNNFVISLYSLLPNHIQNILGIARDKVNCLYSAMDYHIPQPKLGTITSWTYVNIKSDFEKFLKIQCYELTYNEPIKMGDILTVENPAETGDNFHHAAIVINKDFILEKPNSYLSPLRITPMDTLFKEWADKYNWKSPSDPTHTAIRVRFFRKY